jgi:agmatinase
VRKRVREQLDAGRIAIVVGGDHSVPFGAFEAYAAKYPGLGILHFDAHYDLRVAYGGFTWSHASIMYNALARIPAIATIVHVGVRDFCEAELRQSEAFGDRSIGYGELMLRDRLAAGEPWRQIADEIASRLPDKVYVSFDIDGLDPALCPGTGTPVPGGLSFYEATSLIEAVVRSGRTVVGADLVEVAPSDGDREWNANVGARLLYKLIGFCVQS